jgi:hypothetical protein
MYSSAVGRAVQGPMMLLQLGDVPQLQVGLLSMLLRGVRFEAGRGFAVALAAEAGRRATATGELIVAPFAY